MERSKQLAYLGNRRRTYGTGVAACLAGAAGQQWRREVVGARGGVGTTDVREAVAATDVGRGGGGVLGVAWAQGRGIGEEHKEEDGPGIYRPYPFTPGAISPPGVKVLYPRCVLPTRSKGTFTPGASYQPGVKVYLYSRLVTRTGSKGFFWRATKLQPTFLSNNAGPVVL